MFSVSKRHILWQEHIGINKETFKSAPACITFNFAVIISKVRGEYIFYSFGPFKQQKSLQKGLWRAKQSNKKLALTPKLKTFSEASVHNKVLPNIKARKHCHAITAGLLM